MRRSLLRLAVLALLSSLASAPGFAQTCTADGGQCPLAGHEADEPVRHSELDTAIHDYLVTHPEVLLEAQKALAAKQTEEREAKARAAIADNRAALVADPADGEFGNPHGDVTIVEFFDNQCPYCKALAPVLDQLVAADPNVRIVLKEFPILGPGSDLAARYALAVKRQGKYTAFHAALMADLTPEGQLAEPRLLEIAKSLGLDLDRLKQDISAPAFTEQTRRTIALARTVGVTGTPGLVIGTSVQSGAMPLDSLKEAVRNARSHGERS